MSQGSRSPGGTVRPRAVPGVRSRGAPPVISGAVSSPDVRGSLTRGGRTRMTKATKRTKRIGIEIEPRTYNVDMNNIIMIEVAISDRIYDHVKRDATTLQVYNILRESPVVSDIILPVRYEMSITYNKFQRLKNEDYDDRHSGTNMYYDTPRKVGLLHPKLKYYKFKAIRIKRGEVPRIELVKEDSNSVTINLHGNVGDEFIFYTKATRRTVTTVSGDLIIFLPATPTTIITGSNDIAYNEDSNTLRLPNNITVQTKRAIDKIFRVEGGVSETETKVIAIEDLEPLPEINGEPIDYSKIFTGHGSYKVAELKEVLKALGGTIPKGRKMLKPGYVELIKDEIKRAGIYDISLNATKV